MNEKTRIKFEAPNCRRGPRTLQEQIVEYEQNYDLFKKWKDELAAKAIQKKEEKMAVIFRTVIWFFVFSHVLVGLEALALWRMLRP